MKHPEPISYLKKKGRKEFEVGETWYGRNMAHG